MVALVAGAAAAACVAVGAVVAGRMVWADDAARLDVALAQAPAVKVAEIPGADGSPTRGVFVQVTSTGLFCVSDAPLDTPTMGGGGCNPADEPLGGSAISASLSYDGGPEIATVQDARLSGLAAAHVASVRVLMSNGTFRSVRLTKAAVGSDEFEAFGYRFKKSDLKKGIGPIAVIALDANGTEIGRQTTGIGG